MKRILGRKQTTNNAKWLEALQTIETLVSLEELEEQAKKTVATIKKITRGKKVAFSWSGGKDSIVLAHICQRAGITACMFAHTELEYPAFLKWCMENKPEGCEVINTGQGLDWLAKHEAMIFPKGKELNRWYAIVQRAAFTKYFFDNKLDMILVGHRKADGNVVGPNNILTKNSGEVRYSPLADWSHEMLLAYIHYYKLDLPPIYEWKDGFKCGTHPWPSRMYMKSVEQGYAEVYEIDPSIVIAAAEKIESARRFLEERR